MELRWLELANFRSYSSLRWDPDPGVNIVVGDNGAGKTNLLEAVSYLSGMKSFRGATDPVLVRLGAAAAVLRGEFDRKEGSVLVEIEIPAQGRRKVQVNGKRPARLRGVAAELPVVTFLPDDLDLVKGGPARRRDYLDDLAAQLWPGAAGEQDDYERAIRQRNALLREYGPGVAAAELEVWDERVSEAGGAVTARRLRLLTMLRPRLHSAYREVAGPDGGSLGAEYGSRIPTPAGVTTSDLTSALREALRRRRSVDAERRVTTVGPHRDEVTFRIEAREARTMASQGEQRSVALAMRLAAYDLVGEGDYGAPLLVLDDVFSELDGRRAAAVVRRLPAGQVFVSTARDEDFPVTGRRWRVTGGEVRAA